MKIVIVGGGTASWSCAAALSKNKKLDICVIDPKDSSAIGVGESTLPLIRQFHKMFSLFEDNTWLKRVNGTLKYTLEFENFMEDKKSKWVHPLSTYKKYEEFMTLKNTHMDNLTLSDSFFYAQKIRNKYFSDLENYELEIGAFHLDALLYTKELKDISMKRGVSCIEKSVKSIVQEEDITKFLILEDDSNIYGELFIDCTGLKNLLFDNLKSEFISFKDRLYCDSAVAIKLDYKDEKVQKINATLAKGLKNGWVWHVPLGNKIGFGYVFSSRHIRKEDAKKEFFDYLEDRYDYNLENLEAKFIKYRCGVHKNSWIGNNIAIGLSSFFIEPLESTGIALFQIQIMELYRILDTNPKFYKNYKDSYNKTIYEYVLSVKDFLEMHYICSNREDTQFWRDSNNIIPNEMQKKILNLYKMGNRPELLNYSLAGIFGNVSWLHLLLGMNKK